MSSVTVDVVILCWNTAAKPDHCAYKIAQFLGAEATLVSLSPAALGDVTSIRKLVPACTCLIVDAETLAKAADAMGSEVRGLSSLTNEVAKHVFIYGFQPTDRHAALIQTLSSSALLGVHPRLDV